MEPWYGTEEKIALIEYMESGGWLTEYQKTLQFEKSIAEYTNSKHAIVVNNGTISLTLAAIALNIGYGDEVIIPNYTMIASPNSIKMLGAVPRFVDVDEDTLCLSLDKTKQAINKKTKAIMIVLANGRYPSEGINSFVELAKKHNISLIEDAAQALGSYYPDGKHIGTVGEIGSFSFSTPKVITTGQGGALITNSDILASKIRKLKDFGRSGGGNDIHDSIGYNFKFTEMQAVIGIEQMKKLQFRVERKKSIYRLYKKNLEGLNSVRFFNQDLVNTTPWFIDVLVDKRDELQEFLKQKSIGTRIMYPPINRQMAYNLDGEYPVSAKVGKMGLWLPSGSQLKDEEIEYICESIRMFYNFPR